MAIIITRDGTELKGAGNVTSLSAENKKIVNLVDPTSDQDAATKAYVDNSSGTASSALDGTFTIDNTADPTKQIDFDASGITASNVRTIIMPDADVNLGQVNTALQTSQLGAASGVASLNASGKLTASQVPGIAITSTFVVVSEVAQLALTVEEGDVAVRTDENKTYIALNADNADMGDWQELLTPTDAVTSVNGATGIVVLDSDDISEGATNLYYTTARFTSDFAGKSTSDLSEGSNLYFTVARVLSSALTGISFADSSAVDATDTVLEAIGKLQARSKLNNMVASADPAATNDSSEGYVDGSLWYNATSNQLFVLEDDTVDAAVWQDITSDQAVASVNGETGTVVLDSDDISEGAANFYYTEGRFDTSLAAKDSDDVSEGAANFYYTEGRFDTSLAAKDSDDVSEGVTNLYFTDARAKSAAVADAINNGTTDVAPSQNAVFDALALKANDSELTSAEGDIDVLQAETGKVFDDGFTGEALESNEMHFVRRAKSGETAGRYYKALADSFANSRVVGFVITGVSALVAGDPVRVYKMGEGSLGSSDTGLGAGNINSPIYLSQSEAGKFTISPSSSSGAILKPIGYVANDTVIDFQPNTAIQA